VKSRSALSAASVEMHRAAGRLDRRQVAPAVADQTDALKHLDLAFAAAVQAVQRAAGKAQQQVQARTRQVTADPDEYDPNARPPGSLGPGDLARVRRWNVNLPPRVRREIIAALGDPFPVGFEALLRRYYEDLSQEAWDRLDLRQPRRE